MPHKLQNWKMTLCYDGTDFFGWQVQPELRTIQGELLAALSRITGLTPEALPLPQGSGRTDAGVHALGQVASFAVPKAIPANNLMRALNRTLPAAIRAISVEPAPQDFHARHTAIGKRYEYRIHLGEDVSPFLARYVWGCRWSLNLDAMNRAAASVLGEHDFTSFAASDPDKAARESGDEVSAVRTLHSSEWSQEGGLLFYRVRGNGFLHHMVRNLVGTMVEIGRGQIADGSMSEILSALSRSAAGPTAPARGLFLHSVEYPI